MAHIVLASFGSARESRTGQLVRIQAFELSGDLRPWNPRPLNGTPMVDLPVIVEPLETMLDGEDSAWEHRSDKLLIKNERLTAFVGAKHDPSGPSDT